MAVSWRLRSLNSCLMGILLLCYLKKFREYPRGLVMEETLLSLIGDTLNCDDHLSFNDLNLKRYIQRFLSPEEIILR